MSIWTILEIEQTTDLAAIKKAYARKLKLHHPEDDPAGYQQLRQAYDIAIKNAKRAARLAREADDDDDALPEQVPAEPAAAEPVLEDSHSHPAPRVVWPDGDENHHDDNSRSMPTPRAVWPDGDEDHHEDDSHSQPAPRIVWPDGDENHHEDDSRSAPTPRTIRVREDSHHESPAMLVQNFINSMQAIYDDFASRINAEKWRSLLSSDVLWRVGTYDYFQTAILEFLTRRHHLPKTVWLLLDHHFSWSQNKQELLEQKPNPILPYIFQQLESDAELCYSFIRAETLSMLALETFLDCREKALNALIANDLQAAGAAIYQAYAIYAEDPDLLRLQGEYWLREGNAAHALAACNQAVRIVPNELDSYHYRAKILYQQDDIPAAHADCLTMLNLVPSHIDACYLLALCELKLNHLEEAKRLFTLVLEQRPNHLEIKAHLINIEQQLTSGTPADNRFDQSRLKPKPLLLDFPLLLVKRAWMLILAIIWAHFLLSGISDSYSYTGNKTIALPLDEIEWKVFSWPETSFLSSTITPHTEESLRIKDASYLGIVRVQDNGGKGDKPSFMSQDEAQIRNKMGSISGYLSVGMYQNQAYILITDYESAKEISIQHKISLKGKLKTFVEPKLLDTVQDEFEPFNNRYHMAKIDNYQFIEADNAGVQNDTRVGLTIMLLIISVLYFYFIRELYRSYRTVLH
ncbi:CDC27 family protein [Paenibacillus sp. MMS18-CY102]|uniref:CDC27 family protein n=1 Tax=Paenibacillus sp. MMS18-CY102 TaxID=2682849 RepID=UPI001365A3D3|nr:CDC27 family protein [Paenibacillus sp. MMS18-CY102]MWC29676.1 hypothetical protein [Paenibacillus sp. MMS18-CY102]